MQHPMSYLPVGHRSILRAGGVGWISGDTTLVKSAYQYTYIFCVFIIFGAKLLKINDIFK